MPGPDCQGVNKGRGRGIGKDKQIGEDRSMGIVPSFASIPIPIPWFFCLLKSDDTH